MAHSREMLLVAVLVFGCFQLCNPEAVAPVSSLALCKAPCEQNGWQSSLMCMLPARLLRLRGGGAPRSPTRRRPVDGALEITLALTSKQGFAATSKFPPKEVTDVYKRHGGRWDPTQRLWTFSLDKHERLAADLIKVKPAPPSKGLKIHPIPELVLRSVANKPHNNLSAVETLFESMPQSIRDSLLPFQREGVRFAIEWGGRALIADEMGLGKTLQAIAVSSAFLSDWPVLIVCPSSVREMWSEEIKRWLPGLVGGRDVHVIYNGRDRIPSKPVTIVSYDLFGKMTDELSAMGYGIVIADEAHYLKNPQAKRTLTAIPFLRAAKRAILLSGTPALARPAELFTLLSALCPETYPDFIKFAFRYCNAHQGPFGLDTGGSSNLGELHLLLQQVMVRRLKNDVLTQLPAKRRQRVVVDMSKMFVDKMAKGIEDIKELDKVASDDTLDPLERLDAANRKRVLITQMYVETGKAKIPDAQAYVADLVDGGAKLIVFGHHIEVLDAVEATVVKKKLGFIRIDGSTPAPKRQDLVTRFQKDPSVRVAILAMTAAGTGLTLTASNTVLFVELSWTPGVLMQAEDRAHRIGQNSSVNVHYLVARDSADDLIWDSLARKISVVGQTLDGTHSVFESTTMQGFPRGGVTSTLGETVPGADSIKSDDIAAFFRSHSTTPEPSGLRSPRDVLVGAEDLWSLEGDGEAAQRSSGAHGTGGKRERKEVDCAWSEGGSAAAKATKTAGLGMVLRGGGGDCEAGVGMADVQQLGGHQGAVLSPRAGEGAGRDQQTIDALMSELSRVRAELRRSRQEVVALQGKVIVLQRGETSPQRGMGPLADEVSKLGLEGDGFSPVSSPTSKGDAKRSRDESEPSSAEKKVRVEVGEVDRSAVHGQGEGGTDQNRIAVVEELADDDPELVELMQGRAAEDEDEAKELNGDKVTTELVNLAKEFPMCASFLMNEFDSRRLLTDSGHTVDEDRVKRIMSKVARQSKDSDMRLMAMYIGEKLGGKDVPAQSQIAIDLEKLPEDEREDNARLRRCTCTMTSSMRCTCGGGASRRWKNGGSSRESVRSSHHSSSGRNRGQSSMLSSSAGGEGESRASTSVADTSHLNKWKLGHIRKAFGNVTVEPGDVMRVVSDMGGLECVDGLQGAKGKGWKAVAAQLGIDTLKNRDAGYQVKKIYMKVDPQVRQGMKLTSGGESDVTGAGEDGKDGAWWSSTVIRGVV